MITGRINIHLLVYIVFAVSLFFPRPVFIISLTCRICNRGKRTEHLPVDISGFCFLSLHSVTTIPVFVQSVQLFVLKHTYGFFASSIFPFSSHKFYSAAVFSNSFWRKKKLTLNSPSTACRISRVRSCWTLMYKPLLILEYEFHHTRHWFVSCAPTENGSLFCVMLITTDWRTGWCNGVHQSLKKEASVILFVRLSSAFNVWQGFHSEMRSTDTNWC